MWTQVINRRPSNIDVFRSQMNRLFSDFDTVYADFAQTGETIPYTTMHDTGDQFVLQAEVPDMSKDDIQIKIQGNYLEISGNRKTEVPEGYKAHRTERSASSFTRSFTLASDVNVDTVEAELDDGILSLKLPKVETAKVKQIEIK